MYLLQILKNCDCIENVAREKHFNSCKVNWIGNLCGKLLQDTLYSGNKTLINILLSKLPSFHLSFLFIFSEKAYRDVQLKKLPLEVEFSDINTKLKAQFCYIFHCRKSRSISTREHASCRLLNYTYCKIHT